MIFLRNSCAPGFGDPENFKIDDCSTQRKLSNEVVLQARKFGKFFLIYQIEFSEILTSEWCRCKDTIKEMNVGDWKTFKDLNSFFKTYLKKNSLTFTL